MWEECSREEQQQCRLSVVGPIHALLDSTFSYSLYPFSYSNANNSRRSQRPFPLKSYAKSQIICGRKPSPLQPCFLPSTATSAARCRFSRRELEPSWCETDEAGVEHSLLRGGLGPLDSRMLSLRRCEFDIQIRRILRTECSRTKSSPSYLSTAGREDGSQRTRSVKVNGTGSIHLCVILDTCSNPLMKIVVSCLKKGS